MVQLYSRPPIIEAALQLVFTSPLSFEEMAKARKRTIKFFPQSEDLKQISFMIEEGGHASSTAPSITGHKLTSMEGTRAVLIYPDRLGFSILAPYPGWDQFVSEFRDIIKLLKRQGTVAVSSTRFINRIDVPAPPGSLVNHDDYFRLARIELPFDHGPLTGFGVQIAAPVGTAGHRVVLNASLAPSPLIDHLSILLDVDVLLDASPPLKQAEVWGRMNELRDWKNHIFEESITDKARELFR